MEGCEVLFLACRNSENCSRVQTITKSDLQTIRYHYLLTIPLTTTKITPRVYLRFWDRLSQNIRKTHFFVIAEGFKYFRVTSLLVAKCFYGWHKDMEKPGYKHLVSSPCSLWNIHALVPPRSDATRSHHDWKQTRTTASYYR